MSDKTKAGKAEKAAEKTEKPEKAEKDGKSEKKQVKAEKRAKEGSDALVKVEFLVDGKGELAAKLEGCDLGLANLIVERLVEDKSVEFAAVDYDHPTRRTPVLKVTAKNPKKSVGHAISMVLKDIDSLKPGKR